MRFFLTVTRSFYYSSINCFLDTLKALLSLRYIEVKAISLPFVGYKANTTYSVFLINNTKTPVDKGSNSNHYLFFACKVMFCLTF